jgi:hypothetical protein
MIFALDHIVFSAMVPERDRVTSRLEACGFSAEDFFLNFPEGGASSESWSFASGGFVEFVSEHMPGPAGSPWFTETPRVIGLGFASDDFESDTAWPMTGHAWRMDESHAMKDGSLLRIHAAGPHEHQSDFYVFVMDRPQAELQFPARMLAPRLVRITLAGGTAESWRERLSEWLRVPGCDRELIVGDAVLAFAAGSSPFTRASLQFEAELDEPIHIGLGAGEIAVVPSAVASSGL